MKSKLQSIIIILGILSLGLGIWQMLQITTMILSPLYLVLFYSFITICISFVFGLLLKKTLKSDWHILTFSSVFLIIICSVFYISQYKPTYDIIVPDNYFGEVKLFVSNEARNDFTINKYGIGYIDKNTFDKGFYPRVFRKKIDITKQIKEYNRGAFATTQASNYTYEYLSFSIPAEVENIDDSDIDELIKIKAIDTARLYRK